MKRQTLASLIICTLTALACEPNSNNKQTGELAIFDTVDAIEIVEAPKTGVALGWGWNRGDAEPIPTICVEFVPGEEPAQTRYMTMKEVNDSYELMSAMNISAEASVKTIGFEAEGKASFAKSQNITGSKSTFVLNAVVQNGVRYAAPVPSNTSEESKYQPAVGERGGSQGEIRLTPKAAKAARDRDPDKFRRMCGSSFVSAIYGGAKLTSVISIEKNTKKEKEELSAEMSGSGWGAEFSAKLDASAKNESDSETMEVSIFLTGGKGDAIPTSKADLIDKMATISMDAYVAPKDFQLAITPYELLSNWPGKVLPDKESEFDELASYWGAYNTLYDEIQAVLDAPEKYVMLYPEDLAMTVCNKQQTALNNHYANTDKVITDRNKVFKAAKGNANRMVAVTDTYFAIKGFPAKSQNLRKQLASCEKRPWTLTNLRHAQDEVLASLRRMEVEARECSNKSDHCEFDAATYRNPYAFRIQLPVLAETEIKTAADMLDYNVSRVAKNRCSLSSNNPGCLSNAEIDHWAEKIGLTPIHKATNPELFKRYEEHHKALLEAGKNTEVSLTAARYSTEPGQPDVLWVNSRAKLPEPLTEAQNETEDEATAANQPTTP